jgi:hypothetical protein
MKHSPEYMQKLLQDCERELAASQAAYATARSQLVGFEAANAGLRADNDELLARLEEARTSHLHAAARDVQTIQQQAVELAKIKQERVELWQEIAAVKHGDSGFAVLQELHDKELAKWQALAEGLARALTDCKNRAMDKSIETNADDHAKGCVDDIWEWSEAALAAYEAAKSANHD